MRTPGLFGTQMLPRDVAALLYNHGWQDPLNNVRMAATVDAESDRYIKAVGQINANGSQDLGMFQLNSYHRDVFDFSSDDEFFAACCDPEKAATMARKLFTDDRKAGGNGFRPWFAYDTERWHERLPTACRGLCNFCALNLYGKLIL